MSDPGVRACQITQDLRGGVFSLQDGSISERPRLQTPHAAVKIPESGGNRRSGFEVSCTPITAIRDHIDVRPDKRQQWLQTRQEHQQSLGPLEESEQYANEFVTEEENEEYFGTMEESKEYVNEGLGP